MHFIQLIKVFSSGYHNGCEGCKKTYPLSLDDLNEPCTIVQQLLLKKELVCQVIVCYSSYQCSYLAKMI